MNLGFSSQQTFTVRKYCFIKSMSSYLPQLCIKIIDKRISLNCINLDLLSPKPKLTFRHLKSGVAIALKTVNNAVVV